MVACNFACASTSETGTLKHLPVATEKRWSLLKYLSHDVNTEGDEEEQRWMVAALDVESKGKVQPALGGRER